MATFTRNASLDNIVGYDAGGSGLTERRNGALDSGVTQINGGATVTIANGFRFTTSRINGQNSKNFAETAVIQDATSQIVSTGSDNALLAGSFELEGSYIHDGTGTGRLVFGDPSNPGANQDVTNIGAGDNSFWGWEMINASPYTFFGTSSTSNLTVHFARLNPFTSNLQFNSIGNSTLETPSVNSIYRRVPSPTVASSSQAVSGWGYADRMIHQLSPVGNGRIGNANYLEAYGLRTEMDFNGMLSTQPAKDNGRRQMLQINHSVMLWLVRPQKQDANGDLTPLLSSDTVPIGYHTSNYPGQDASRLDDEIRVLIPFRVHFTDEQGSSTTEAIKVEHLPRGSETLEIRDAPQTYSPVIIPNELAEPRYEVSGQGDLGVWIVDSINTYANKSANAVPLNDNNQFIGMNADREIQTRSYRWDISYGRVIGTGGVMTSATEITPLVLPAADLSPFLNGRVDDSANPELLALTTDITDFADIFPSVRRYYKDQTQGVGSMPIIAEGNRFTFAGDLLIDKSIGATTSYSGGDVSLGVAVNDAFTLTGSNVEFVFPDGENISWVQNNIPARIRLGGGSHFAFSTTIDDIGVVAGTTQPTLNFNGGGIYQITNTNLDDFDLNRTGLGDVIIELGVGATLSTIPIGFSIRFVIDGSDNTGTNSRISLFNYNNGILQSSVPVFTTTNAFTIDQADVPGLGSTVVRLIYVRTSDTDLPEVGTFVINSGSTSFVFDFNKVGNQSYIVPAAEDTSYIVNRVSFNNTGNTDFDDNTPENGLRIATSGFIDGLQAGQMNFKFQTDVVNTFPYHRVIGAAYVDGQLYADNVKGLDFFASGLISPRDGTFRMGPNPAGTLQAQSYFLEGTEAGVPVSTFILSYTGSGSFGGSPAAAPATDYGRIQSGVSGAIDTLGDELKENQQDLGNGFGSPPSAAKGILAVTVTNQP